MDRLKHAVHTVGKVVNHGSNADDGGASADVAHGAGKAERHGQHGAEEFERDVGGTVTNADVDAAKPGAADSSAAIGGGHAK